MNYNRAIIVGNLVADPEVRSTPSGRQVSNIRVATNRVWKDQNGETQQSTEFHDVVLWGQLAERVAQFLQKGSLALVEGRLQTRNWQDNDGNNRYKTEIVAQNVQFGPRGSGGGQQKEQGESGEKQNTADKENGGEDNEEEIDIKDIPL